MSTERPTTDARWVCGLPWNSVQHRCSSRAPHTVSVDGCGWYVPAHRPTPDARPDTDALRADADWLREWALSSATQLRRFVERAAAAPPATSPDRWGIVNDTCPSCGAVGRWVPNSNRGRTRPQCVPCGWTPDDPAPAASPEPDDDTALAAPCANGDHTKCGGMVNPGHRHCCACPCHHEGFSPACPICAPPRTDER